MEKCGTIKLLIKKGSETIFIRWCVDIIYYEYLQWLQKVFTHLIFILSNFYNHMKVLLNGKKYNIPGPN